MTQIFDDPKSCMFSSTCAAGRRLDPPGPGLIKTIDSLRYRTGVRWTSRRFFAATAGGGQFVCEMFAATSPARAASTSGGRGPASARHPSVADPRLHRRSS
jgi:hypothetical protein